MTDDLDVRLREHPRHRDEQRCPLCVMCPHCRADPGAWCHL